MSVQNAGSVIRDARLKAGLTQDQLSEGICTTLSLSRIENGSAGVCPSTFQALMAHAGAPCEAYPVFASRTDFDCFYALKRVRFYLDCWQLQYAFDELEKIEAMHWVDNKLYYQEWLLLYCKLQFRSGSMQHQAIYDTLLDALHISRPTFDIFDFRNLLLSIPEIELCTLLAQEALYLGNMEQCFNICTQISTYLSGSQLTFFQKDRLLAEHAVVYAKYLLAVSDNENALKIADTFRHTMVVNLDDSPLIELTFLTALGYYYTGDTEKALFYFKTAFFSAHSIESCYANACRNYVKANLNLPLPDAFDDFADIPQPVFPYKKVIDYTAMNDGIYDLSSSCAFTLGDLIRELRTEQKLSQAMLCQGLCRKSKLSKIENNTLQPEIILSQTLLQRLGISDLVFTFYGNEKEHALQNLNDKLCKTRVYETDNIQHLIANIKALCNESDFIYLQYAKFHESVFQKNFSMRITVLNDALHLTLPNFSFRQIFNYRFSQLELSILNKLCATYTRTNPSIGIQSFYKLLEYYQNTDMDVLSAKRFLPITIGSFIRFLYSQKRWPEITEFSKFFSIPVLRSSLYFTGYTFFHYCQALAEQNHSSLASTYGNYAYYVFSLMEEFDGASHLKNALKNTPLL